MCARNDRPDAPEWNFFPQAEKRGKDEDPERDRAEGQTERSPSDGVMLGRSLNQRRRETNPRRHLVRMEISDVKKARRDRGHANEKEPGKMLPIIDPHLFKTRNSKFEIRN